MNSMLSIWKSWYAINQMQRAISTRSELMHPSKSKPGYPSLVVTIDLGRFGTLWLKVKALLRFLPGSSPSSQPRVVEAHSLMTKQSTERVWAHPLISRTDPWGAVVLFSAGIAFSGQIPEMAFANIERQHISVSWAWMNLDSGQKSHKWSTCTRCSSYSRLVYKSKMFHRRTNGAPQLKFLIRSPKTSKASSKRTLSSPSAARRW